MAPQCHTFRSLISYTIIYSENRQLGAVECSIFNQCIMNYFQELMYCKGREKFSYALKLMEYKISRQMMQRHFERSITVFLNIKKHVIKVFNNIISLRKRGIKGSYV